METVRSRGTFGFDSVDSLADAEWAHDYNYNNNYGLPPEDWVEDFYDSETLDLLVNENAFDWEGTTDTVITDSSVFLAHT